MPIPRRRFRPPGPPPAPVDLEQILSEHAGFDDVATLLPENFRQAPGARTTAPFSRQVLPPWTTKLPSSQDFNRNLFSSALGAVVGATVTPVSFQVPLTFVGYMSIFGVYVLTPTALTDITFALRINQGPVQGYDNIRVPPGVANFFVQNFSDLQVRIPSGALVDVLVTNNAATGPWTVGAKISGWYHSEIEEQRIYGSL